MVIGRLKSSKRSASTGTTRLFSLINVPLRDPKHVEWVRKFINLLEESRKYNMEYHATGLSWNAKVLYIFA